MKRRGYSLMAGAVIAASALVLAGCAPAGDDETESGGVLRIAQYGADAINFSAGFFQDPELSLLAKAVYDSLFTSENGGTEMTPGLATEWSYDEARTTLTIELREDVTFSDGSELDAQDVKDTLDWVASLPEGAPFAQYYTDSEVIDEHTLVIHQPEAKGLVLLNLRRMAITSSEAIANPDSMVTDPIGTGPYVLNRDDSIEASSYVLDKREDAWEADTYPFEQLVFHLVGTDPSAAVNSLRAGQVDFVAYTDGSTADSLIAEGFEAIPYYALYMNIVLDSTGGTVPALADVRVRQAISYAFDREGIAEGVNYGYGNPTSQLEANPDGPMYRPGRDDEYAYNVEKARQLLAEAGYPDGFDMDLVNVQGSPYAPVIKQAFADIGINLEYVEILGDDYVVEYGSGRYSAMFSGSTPGEASADFGLGYVVNPWPGNTTPELTEILRRLDTSDDEGVREASADFGDFILDQAWTVIVAHPGTVQIADPKVVDFREYKTWLGQIPLRAMIPAG
jgi:peptide/nickel transport system substrate-binding protein